jgi:hypothetical protein
MPIKISSASDIAAKWAEVTPGRQKYYEANTPAAASDWERETKASAPTFQAAVTAGDIGRRFSGGVTKAGAAKFARKVTALGVSRFGPGVREAQSDMASGFDPFVATIASVSLPARGPRGDPGNLDRVRVVAAALAAKRLALIGAG